MANVFELPGEWLRCQLHAHTVNSDGDATPAELVAHYAGLGFDVLAITDHHFVTAFPTDDLLVIPSSELTARPAAALEVDVLALGAERLPEPNDVFASVEDAARFAVEAGGLAFLAHPYWSGLESAVYLEAPSLTGIELMNGGSELANGNGRSAEFWDAVLHHTRGACLGIAADDCHSPGKDSNLAWTMVRSVERSRAGCAGRASKRRVLRHLRAGDRVDPGGASRRRGALQRRPGGHAALRAVGRRSG